MTIIYALSDSLGETAEMVARATASQFAAGTVDIIRIPYINSPQQVEDAVKEAVRQPGVICHTMVSADLRETLILQARNCGVPTIDIMGPMIGAVQSSSGQTPLLKPGLVHKLDQEYFRRVEAVEFAVKYDDGKNPPGLTKADLVIIGVSRTSKTPLSMYLAHKGLKVANVPMVPEISPPEQLFEVPPERIVGLIINQAKLYNIRLERLKVMGLGQKASYANIERILEELEYAKSIMNKLKCPIIDVSNRAIEETANKVLEIARKNRLLYNQL